MLKVIYRLHSRDTVQPSRVMISDSILTTLEDELYAEVQIPPMSSAPSVLSIAGISEADIFREEVRMVCSYDVQGPFCIWTGLRNSMQRTS